MNKPKISIKVANKDGKVKRVSSNKRRRIYRFLKANNFLNCLIEVCVTYGAGITNKGVYKNQTDSINALKAFLEVTSYL